MALRFGNDMVRRDAEVFEQRLGRARRTEARHADEAAALAEIAVPAEAYGRLDADAHGIGAEHRRAVGAVLLVEEFPAGQRYDGRPHAALLQPVSRSDR